MVSLKDRVQHRGASGADHGVGACCPFGGWRRLGL